MSHPEFATHAEQVGDDRREAARKLNLMQPQDVEARIRQWLEQVVIGLNLCPFARGPYQQGLVRIAVCNATTEEAVLQAVRDELNRLRETESSQLETTLLVTPQCLTDFDDFNQFLDEVEFVLRRSGNTGHIQVATFHPDYQFDGTTASDRSNYTNRAPYPVLHFLREASITRAVENFPDPDSIPERNISRMDQLNPDEMRTLFPWEHS